MRPPTPRVVIVGGGAAGMLLLDAIRSRADLDHVRVTLVEPPAGDLTPQDRTWCFWGEDADGYDDLLDAAWDRVAVVGPDGERAVTDIRPMRYRMLSSRRFLPAIRRRHAGTFDAVEAAVSRVDDHGRAAHVSAELADGTPTRIEADWVFDTRPPASPPPARVRMPQHFRGWFVRAAAPVFDPSAATMMDFRVPQHPGRTCFVYVLPTSATEALVEYTEFGGAPLPDDEAERAVAHACRMLGLGDVEVLERESGVIPMSDERRPGAARGRVFDLGARGGAIRPSTGYSVQTSMRQARTIAERLAAGRRPAPQRPHRRLHLAADAVLLRGLHTRALDGAALLARLLRGRQTVRTLRFLDGSASLADTLSVAWRSPRATMIRLAVGVARNRRARA